jgi:hypothetical protein
LSNRNATPGRGIVQRRYLVPVVLLPLTVLVLKDLVAEQGTHIALVERAERFDGELDQCLDV